MKKAIFALTALVIVAACGADDPPFRPSANVGVNIGPNGVSPNVNLGATNGTVGIGVNL
ncbi:MAG: hypothetical protein AAGL89_18870 [Pseudomonadota bacterium]